MPRITVGYQDGTIHPLWLVGLGMRMARLFGAQSLWVQDHYMGFIPAHVWTPEVTPAAKAVHSPDAYFDALQILAVTATKIRGADIGTLVTEPIRHHPMSLAQSFVTLDHISKGRAILGIGNGKRENVEPYGLPWRKQVSRLEEALTIIRKLWSSGGRPVDHDGEFWRLRDAVFNLPLYAGRAPRIWIASHAARMLAPTGRFGDGWVPAVRVGPQEYRRRLEVIAQAARDAGRSMDGFVPAQLMLTAIGRSRDEVVELTMKSRRGVDRRRAKRHHASSGPDAEAAPAALPARHAGTMSGRAERNARQEQGGQAGQGEQGAEDAGENGGHQFLR